MQTYVRTTGLSTRCYRNMIERVKMQSKKTIGISIDRDLLTDIDGLRGLVPRSAYIADLLYKAIRAPT